jgi:glycosyltransferase involved in cell wall biosynthesis
MAKILESIADRYDVVHNHCYPEFINLLVEKNFRTPMVTTVHAQMTPEMDETLSHFKGSYLVSISRAHKKLAKKAKIWKVIHNGIDTDLYSFHPDKKDYLLWLGRLSKAKDKKGNFLDPKGVRWAIRLARETKSNLLLSGNVEDREFFEKDVKPYLSNKIKWIGPVSSEQPLTKRQVTDLMQKAKAFLMTINWYEPFGLVMAEAMSCGTPVIGFDRGSVSELVVNGKTGFVVKPREGAVGLKEALKRIGQIKPVDCRKHVERNFSLGRMVENYEKAYIEVLKKK